MDPDVDDAMPRQQPHDDGAHAPDGTACLDANLLAGYAEERLDDERRLLVEGHLAGCDACRAVVLALHPVHAEAAASSSRTLAAAGEDAGRRPTFRLLRPLVALAAAAAVVAGLALALRSPPPTAAPSLRERLMAAAGRAQAQQPGLLDGFQPLTEAELASTAPVSLRGGIAIARPAEVVLTGPTEIAFAAVPGALDYAVAVLHPDGTRRWSGRVRGTSLPWPAEVPPLAAGESALIEVLADGAFGRSEGRRVVRVLDASAAARFAAAARALEQQALEQQALEQQALGQQARGQGAPAEGDLLRAHLALRAGLLEEAERAARAYARAEPGEPLGQATLALVLRRLGLPPPPENGTPR